MATISSSEHLLASNLAKPLSQLGFVIYMQILAYLAKLNYDDASRRDPSVITWKQRCLSDVV